MPPTPTFNVSHHRSTGGVSLTPASSGSSSFAGGLSAMLGSTVNGWVSASPVETLVARACDPSLPEPPYPVHLELAEYINKKKANTPREAVMASVRMVNHRNPHVSILALALIDSLVQSCGYAVHLQVATKEFLNELVRRFPERPPPFPGPVMQRILELIHSWKESICTSSRWKEDLGNIRDMHRLLSFKGYRFRDLSRGNVTVSQDASETLKSPEELEAEDREAQSAKLQELLRRGTPKDLAAAQELMKILAEADPDAKPDYRAQTLKELHKVEAKVILLNEMLDNVDTSRGEQFVAGDVYDQVATAISSATPKIQKWISEAETDDPESLDVFLQINDQINSVISRYDAFKRGDYVAAANPVPPELGQMPAKDSLIDLMDDESAAPSGKGSTKPSDDLADIFGPTVAAPPTAPSAISSQTRAADIMNLFNQSAPRPAQPSLFHPQPQPQPQPQFQQPPPQQPFTGGYPGQMGQIMLPSTPQPQNSNAGSPSAGTPVPLQTAHAQAQKDPFADLANLF